MGESVATSQRTRRFERLTHIKPPALPEVPDSCEAADGVVGVGGWARHSSRQNFPLSLPLPQFFRFVIEHHRPSC
jgi:hypothetical protein